MRPVGGAISHQTVELVRLQAAGIELAADLIQRDQRVVTVEGRVLDSLGGDRSTDLLQLEREMTPCLAPLLIQAGGELEQEHRGNEVEQRSRHAGIATLRPAYGQSDAAMILFARFPPARRHIGTVNLQA